MSDKWKELCIGRNLSCSEIVWVALSWCSTRMVCLVCAFIWYGYNLDFNADYDEEKQWCPRCDSLEIEEARV